MEDENLEEYLEKALSVNRRSLFFIDESIQSEELFKNLSQIDEVSDENVVQAVAKTLFRKRSKIFEISINFKFLLSFTYLD